MISKLADLLYIVTNWSPVFHFSNDSRFGSLDGKKPDRFSLVCLSLGKTKSYLISYEMKNKKITFIKRINIDDLYAIKTESEISEKVCSYSKNDLSGNSDDYIRNQIDFLKHKIELGKSRTASGYNKVDFYTTLMLVYLGFISYLIGQVVDYKGGNDLYRYVIYMLLSMSAYYALNCSLFIKAALSIRGYVRSSFKDLKIKPDLKNLACSYYRDWYSINNEAQVIISIVTNVEKYFFRSLLIAISSFIIIFFIQHHELGGYKILSRSGEYLIFDQTGGFQNEELINLLSILDDGRNNIYILRSKGNKQGEALGRFIKLIISNQKRIVDIEIENKILDHQSVLVKYRK